MLRQNSPSNQASSSSPLTRAQLQTAIEAEERRLGLTPDSLVGESTLEEAARRLGISPDKLREKALKASVPQAVPRTRRAPQPFWTRGNKKLFTIGTILALTLTAYEGLSRLQIFQHAQKAYATMQRSRPSTYATPRFSPVNDRFKSLLAKTVGPNATLRAVVQENRGWIEPGKAQEEFFPLAGIPDGYEVFSSSSTISDLGQENYRPVGIVFRETAEVDLLIKSSMIDSNTVLPWRFFYYGGQWYARGWIYPSELSKVSASAFGADIEISPFSVPNATEIVIPASQVLPQARFGVRDAEGKQKTSYFARLPVDFKVDTNLVAAAQKRGAFRAEVPNAALDGQHSDVVYAFKQARFSVSSNLVEVSQIKEGTPIPIPNHMLSLLVNDPRRYANNGSQEVVRRVDLRPEIHGDWNLVRYGNTLYLRGWIAGPVRKDALTGKSLLVSSSPQNPQLGYQPVKITVPLTWLYGNNETDNGWSVATLKQVTLDEHAWENW